MIPLWERPVEHFLNGPLGIAPLAVLAQLPDDVPLEQSMAGIIRRLCVRLQQEAPAENFGKLVTSAFVLSELRIKRHRAWSLFRGVKGMHESDTYLAILDEGAIKEVRKLVLRLGQKRFGPPSEDVVTAVNGIEDLARLERMHEGILDVSNWQEFLQMP